MKLIVAQSIDGVIAVNDKLPWNLPTELQHFKNETLNKSVILGRKTFDAMGQRLLPRRQSYILSNSQNKPNHYTSDEIEELIDFDKSSTVYVIGGAEVYKKYLQEDVVDEIIVTIVDCFLCPDREENDVTHFDIFSLINKEEWELQTRKQVYSTKDEYDYTIFNYVKRK